MRFAGGGGVRGGWVVLCCVVWLLDTAACLPVWLVYFSVVLDRAVQG